MQVDVEYFTNRQQCFQVIGCLSRIWCLEICLSRTDSLDGPSQSLVSCMRGWHTRRRGERGGGGGGRGVVTQAVAEGWHTRRGGGYLDSMGPVA